MFAQPERAREKSVSCPMRRAICRALREMTSTPFATTSPSASLRLSISAQPMMAVVGVRSSWETIARSRSLSLSSLMVMTAVRVIAASLCDFEAYLVGLDERPVAAAQAPAGRQLILSGRERLVPGHVSLRRLPFREYEPVGDGGLAGLEQSRLRYVEFLAGLVPHGVPHHQSLKAVVRNRLSVPRQVRAVLVERARVADVYGRAARVRHRDGDGDALPHAVAVFHGAEESAAGRDGYFDPALLRVRRPRA